MRRCQAVHARRSLCTCASASAVIAMRRWLRDTWIPADHPARAAHLNATVSAPAGDIFQLRAVKVGTIRPITLNNLIISTLYGSYCTMTHEYGIWHMPRQCRKSASMAAYAHTSLFKQGLPDNIRPFEPLTLVLLPYHLIPPGAQDPTHSHHDHVSTIPSAHGLRTSCHAPPTSMLT